MAECILELAALVDANAEALTAELRTAIGVKLGGVNRGPRGWWLNFTDCLTADELAQVEAVIAAHNPAALTPEQAAVRAQAATVAAAATRAQAVPAWATISVTDALAWEQTYLVAPIAAGRTALASATTLAQMKPIVSGMLDLAEKQNDVIQKLTMMVLALRDAQWPGLTS